MRSPVAKPQSPPRLVRWIGSTKGDLSAFPEEAKFRIGVALWDAQVGRKSPATKVLKGYGDAGVLEIVADYDGRAFRMVYTVRFAEVIYALHAFEKKSHRGIATPQRDLDLIETRLTRAQEDYKQWRKTPGSQ